jgi:2-oxoisovalerate dehydrogenase E1 component
MHRNLGVFTGRDIPLYRLFSQWQEKPMVLPKEG